MASESLYENLELTKEARSIAALLASKVYYYLGEYDEALSFALGAGAAFEAEGGIAESEEYVETITCSYHTQSQFFLHIEAVVQRRLLTDTSTSDSKKREVPVSLLTSVLQI